MTSVRVSALSVRSSNYIYFAMVNLEFNAQAIKGKKKHFVKKKITGDLKKKNSI